MKPVDHGGDHREGGPDETPSSHGWALAKGSVTAGAGAPRTYIDLTTIRTYGGNTRDDLYSLELGTGGLSSTHGLVAHENGVYKISGVYDFSAFTNGDTVECDIDNGMGFIDDWIFPNDQQTLFNRLTFATGVTKVAYSYLCYVGGALDGSGPALPTGTWPSVDPISGSGGAYTVTINVLMERLSKTYNS